MSCYSCGTTFSRFKKELGCKNCGYAFCKDCLTKKASIPKLKNEKHKVCLKCYKVLTGEVDPEANKPRYSPPAAYKKRMAQLDNKSSQPHQTVPKQPTPNKNKSQFKGLSKADAAIAERLEKLKEGRKQGQDPVPSEQEMQIRLDKLKQDKHGPPPSQGEMEDRLAKLRGQDVAAAHKPHVFQPERRPQVQQVEDLLQEICDEVEIDSRGIDHAADVQNRLDNFRGLGQAAGPGPASADLQNNLNKPDSKDQSMYTKNIPSLDNKYESASGENISWSEMNNIIGQVAAELDVDASKAIAGLQKDKDLWERLNILKQKKKENKDGDTEAKEVNTSGSTTFAGVADDKDDEENEDDACKNIIKQLLEESRLEEQQENEELTGKRMATVPPVPGDTAADAGRKAKKLEDDELPWCCICNSDASLRCVGCDDDLYCKKCYKEGHDREDYKDHPTKPYKPPAK